MNRNPRDLLLGRHAEAAARLDGLRHSIVVAERPVPAREFLPALFRPHRRLWFGLAAAWAMIVALNLFQPSRPMVDSRTLEQAARLQTTSTAQLYALLATTSSFR